MKPLVLAAAALAASTIAGVAIPPGDPVDHGVPRGPRLDLSILEPPPAASFTSIANRWRKSNDQREACELAIRRWEQSEATADSREFADLDRIAEELSAIRREGSASPRWQAGAELLLDATMRRSTAMGRRIERERNLIFTLAALCERPATDPEVVAVRARLTAMRAMQLGSPFAGTDFDLGGFALDRFGRDPSSHHAVEEVARSYWVAMEPLWEARYQSQCTELEEAARDAIDRGGPGGVAKPAVRRSVADACERIIAANDSWIASFVVAATPTESCGERISLCREVMFRSRGRSVRDAQSSLGQDACDSECDVDSPRGRICMQWRQLVDSVNQVALAADFIDMRERVYGLGRPTAAELARVSGAREELLLGIATAHAMALQAASHEE